jgi:sugar O-acyltransferase (sialic acid O-acetyltransferase NeuD family)
MILGIYGAGGLGREFLDLAGAAQAAAETWETIVFIDDDVKEPVVNQARVYTFDAFNEVFPAGVAKIAIAVGEPQVRRILREKVASKGYALQSLIHPTAFIGAETRIGEGAVIQFGSFVSCNVTIGKNALLQANAVVGHDCVVGNDSVISIFASVMGSCVIGERAYIGVGCPVKEAASVGNDAIVGMGSVVLRDIPDGVIALGNPARVMKNNETGRVFK